MAVWDAEASLYDVMRVVQVSVGGVVGTMTEAFSFDGPVASYAMANQVLSGRGSVTVSGLSFRYVEYTATAQLVSAEGWQTAATTSTT